MSPIPPKCNESSSNSRIIVQICAITGEVTNRFIELNSVVDFVLSKNQGRNNSIQNRNGIKMQLLSVLDGNNDDNSYRGYRYEYEDNARHGEDGRKPSAIAVKSVGNHGVDGDLTSTTSKYVMGKRHVAEGADSRVPNEEREQPLRKQKCQFVRRSSRISEQNQTKNENLSVAVLPKYSDGKENSKSGVIPFIKICVETKEQKRFSSIKEAVDEFQESQKNVPKQEQIARRHISMGINRTLTGFRKTFQGHRYIYESEFQAKHLEELEKSENSEDNTLGSVQANEILREPKTQVRKSNYKKTVGRVSRPQRRERKQEETGNRAKQPKFVARLCSYKYGKEKVQFYSNTRTAAVALIAEHELPNSKADIQDIEHEILRVINGETSSFMDCLFYRTGAGYRKLAPLR